MSQVTYAVTSPFAVDYDTQLTITVYEDETAILEIDIDSAVDGTEQHSIKLRPLRNMFYHDQLEYAMEATEWFDKEFFQ